MTYNPFASTGKDDQEMPGYLPRQKLLWQAEILEEAAADAADDSVTAGWLSERASMLRRRAVMLCDED